MSMGLNYWRTSMRSDRRTTKQLLAAAAKDTDAVSVFYNCAEDQEPEIAILVVKGRSNLDMLRSFAMSRGLLTDKPVEHSHGTAPDKST